jgi:hypothetical protein
MPGRFSDYQTEKWLDEIQSDCWLALHFDNPDIAGAYNSEVFGQGYARVRGVFTDASGRAIWNSGTVTWTGLPAVVVTHIAGWNERINGDYLFSVALPNPVRVAAGGRYSVGSNTVALSLD